MDTYEKEQIKNEKEDPTLFFNGKVKIWFPEDFCGDSGIIDKRYPYRNRPSIIRVHKTAEASMAFELYTKPLGANQVSSAAASLKKIIEKIYLYNDEIRLKNFKTAQGLGGISVPFFSIMGSYRQFVEQFVLSLQGQLFIGTVTCPEWEQKRWNPVFRKVKESVEEQKS